MLALELALAHHRAVRQRPRLLLLSTEALIFSFSRRDRSMALDRFERRPSLAGRRRARTPRVRWDPG